ncbi:MAG: SIS domain-containing protein [Longimicrobiales bacterium]
MKDPAGDVIAEQLRGLAALAASVADGMAGRIGEAANRIVGALEAGGKLMFCGNGGSAADAQHLATEYVVRFRHDRRPLPAIALTTDSSLLTAAANDYGFEHVFARQVVALGAPGDVLVLHSTSGVSANLLAAAAAAERIGIVTVALLARGGGPLAELVDYPLVLPTDDGAHAQVLHVAIGHAICDIVEMRMLAGETGAA